MQIVITGANRGIGLGLTKKYLREGHQVWGSCRNPDGARDLWELERDYGTNFKIAQLDVTDAREIAAFKEKMAGIPVDLLINNAGISPDAGRDFASMTAAATLKTFAVNSIGPALICQALLDNLKTSSQPKVLHISSKMGSIADNTSGAYYAYRMSKAALNMFNKSFAIDHPGIISTVAHPGWVKTEMGGSMAPTTVEDSVDGLFKLASSLTREHSGRFFDYQETEIPW